MTTTSAENKIIKVFIVTKKNIIVEIIIRVYKAVVSPIWTVGSTKLVFIWENI